MFREYETKRCGSCGSVKVHAVIIGQGLQKNVPVELEITFVMSLANHNRILLAPYSSVVLSTKRSS